MAGNSFGRIFKIMTFGESHGKAVGVVIDGCPSNVEISEDDIQKELDRRRPGQSVITTSRNEKDEVEIISGVFESKTTGTPICLLVFNKDQRSKDYSKIKDKFRPGHADFTYYNKFGIRDYRGGGRSSARETIGRVCAGAIAKKILKEIGVNIFAYVKQVGDIKANKVDLEFIESNPVRCADPTVVDKMIEKILEVKNAGDSIGAMVEVVIKNVPVGLGEPVFDRLNAEIAKAILSIPAVKGIEFGKGFEVVNSFGSENNDEISKEGFLSNNAGGTLGGISTGQDIVFRFAIKPPSSILVPRKTIDLYGNECEIVTEGRHDPCLGPRVVPVAEAMTAIVLADLYLLDRARRNFS